MVNLGPTDDGQKSEAERDGLRCSSAAAERGGTLHTGNVNAACSGGMTPPTQTQARVVPTLAAGEQQLPF